MQIRRITSEDYADYLKIRMHGLSNSPEAFGMSVEEAPAVERESFEEKTAGDNAVFLCYKNDEVCGIVGVRRLSGQKRQHAATVWGMYVLPSHRHQKIGAALMEEVLRFARNSGIEKLQLSVNTENSSAFGLYQKLGFKTYGTESKALKLSNKYYAEHLMELFL